MTQYQYLNAKLSNSLLDKKRSATKNRTMFDDNLRVIPDSTIIIKHDW